MEGISDWIESLTDKDLTFVELCVRDEIKKRKPRKMRSLSERTISMIADLKLYPPRVVADKHNVSRQYAYEICKRYDIHPVSRRSLPLSSRG